mmetsp:Transcript_18042/g.58278  ORF Transcript_18042/g.58278 Transcript_18042/m.58278 type:complete len:291 (+) Transcript_18042:1721-2593(+)
MPVRESEAQLMALGAIAQSPALLRARWCQRCRRGRLLQCIPPAASVRRRELLEFPVLLLLPQHARLVLAAGLCHVCGRQKVDPHFMDAKLAAVRRHLCSQDLHSVFVLQASDEDRHLPDDAILSRELDRNREPHGQRGQRRQRLLQGEHGVVANRLVEVLAMRLQDHQGAERQGHNAHTNLVAFAQEELPEQPRRRHDDGILWRQSLCESGIRSTPGGGVLELHVQDAANAASSKSTRIDLRSTLLRKHDSSRRHRKKVLGTPLRLSPSVQQERCSHIVRLWEALPSHSD